jgi:phosphatidylserine synthase
MNIVMTALLIQEGVTKGYRSVVLNVLVTITTFQPMNLVLTAPHHKVKAINLRRSPVSLVILHPTMLMIQLLRLVLT